MWTEQKDEKLLKMWSNHSASQIGRELGCTRNAVIGRYHRLIGSYADYVSPSGKRSRAEADRRRQEREACDRACLASMRAAIAAGAPRNDAVAAALANGARQMTIATALGITHQRVSQLKQP